MKHKSQAARRKAGDQRAVERRQTRREMGEARAASGTGPQPQNVAPMKGAQMREEQKMRAARKASRESAQG